MIARLVRFATPRMLKKITIFGTGLIGGSLALALKRAFPGVRISGVDNPDVLARAQKLGIIDVTGLEAADLVVLAAPVGKILGLLDQISKDSPLVTDVGSTKASICNKAERLGLHFVGGHPMAGLEQSGPEAASADLLRDAPFFLCPLRSAPAAVERMKEIVTAIHAVPHVISAEEHDRLVAQISHLPQIVSSILAEHTAFHVWRDIFETSGFLPNELQSFIQRLQYVVASMEAGNLDEIEKLFKRGGSQ